MSNPLVPNYKKDVGRLVTDRYDFEDHVQGSNFRHKAGQVDLFPTLVINGDLKNNVQDAISEIASVLSVPNVPDATSVSKGIVQLSGDISGSATNITVSGLRGYPITTLPPSSGQVLTWTGAAWTPANSANTFSAGGDLSGSGVSQQVVKITGDLSSTVDILASSLIFNDIALNPVISQGNTSASSGQELLIQAQTSTGASFDGGKVSLSGGAGGVGGKSGGVTIGVNELNTVLIDSQEIEASRRVVGLVTGSLLTTSQMPSGTGDMVVYIGDAATAPIYGANPVSGSILYSNGGKLYTKFANGNDFEIGSVPNPSIWGSTGEQTITYRFVSDTNGATRATVLNYVMNNNYSVKFDILYVGKQISTTVNEAYQTNLSMGYSVSSSGTAVDLDLPVSYDTRYSAGASAWLAPEITRSGNTVSVKTGAADLAGKDIRWITIVQLTLVDAS